jgi:protease II
VYVAHSDDTRKSKEVLGHLEKENAFSKAATANLDPLRKTLYDEHKGT